MLSIVDIKRELGENIFLYPLYPESIKGNSLDLHASEFGWSLKQGMSIRHQDYLVIPPGDTALIYTQESLSLSRKLGGALHAKAGLTCKGLEHSSTTLAPQHLGNSLVALHNHSDKPHKLRIGAEFATLLLCYLNTPDYRDTRTHDGDAGHLQTLSGMEGIDRYEEWRDQNKWVVQENILYTKMVNSTAYKECKAEFEQEQLKFNRRVLRRRTARYITLIAVSALILLAAAVPAYCIDLGRASVVLKELTERLLCPLFLAVLTARIMYDVKSRGD